MTDLIPDQRGLTLVEQAGRVEVLTFEDNQRAAYLAREIKTAIEDVKARRMEITRPMREAIDRAIEQEKAVTVPLQEALDHLRGEMARFDRAEQERVLREQAEAEARLARALEEGRATDADEALTDLATIPEPSRMPAGVSRTAHWKGEVEDMTQVLAAILRGDLPMSVVMPNPTGLNTYARGMRKVGVFNGIRITDNRGIGVGTLR